MQKYLCAIGFHKYVTLELTNCFTTEYTDRGYTIEHMVWYQKCSCCGKRYLKDRYKKECGVYTTPHAGIEYARAGWETYGRIYLGPKKEARYDPAMIPKNKSPLKVINGGKGK